MKNEIKMFKNRYYVFEGNNQYDSLKYSYEDAERLSKTLINCRNCINCENCINCDFCIDCKNCDECRNCTECEECGGCYNLRFCKRCCECNNAYYLECENDIQ